MAVRFGPPLPVLEPTTSYWLTDPHPTLNNYCDKFSDQFDTVIIGSGICGTLVAHDLLLRDHGTGNNKRLCMLEARSAASGATGRNGGHIKPDCYRGFTDFQQHFGTETARKQCEFERANQTELSAFIRDQGLAETVDLVDYRSADCFMTETNWKKALTSYNAFKQAGGNVEGILLLSSEEALKELRVKCVGAITYPASSLWPYKLTTNLLERCLKKGLSLYTNTPALGISQSIERRWKVTTDKGDIHCDRVVHCTNGYAHYLVPELSDALVCLRGHAIAIDPSPNYHTKPLTHSYALHSGDDYDYLIQRPTDGKPLIYGGGDTSHPEGLFNGIGNFDDSQIVSSIADHLAERIVNTFIHWDREAKYRCAWTGIMGLTYDEMPFVGELPGKPGQYIAAGYNGHGMARVFLTSRALCQRMYGEAVDPRTPLPYFNIESRMKETLPYWTAMLIEARKDGKPGC